jgi:hypothetical protein
MCHCHVPRGAQVFSNTEYKLKTKEEAPANSWYLLNTRCCSLPVCANKQSPARVLYGTDCCSSHFTDEGKFTQMSQGHTVENGGDKGPQFILEGKEVCRTVSAQRKN